MDIKQSVQVLAIVTIGCVAINANNLENEMVQQHCASDQSGTIWKCNFIPTTVPDNYTRVDIEVSDYSIYCHNDSFISKTWDHIETLNIVTSENVNKDVFFYDYCFSNLKNLRHLGINVDVSIFLEPNVFIGLDYVTKLSLSDCTRLDWNTLLAVLNGTDKLPNLTDLDLTKVHSFLGPVAFDETFANVLGTRNITRINLSATQVSFLNGTALFLRALKHLSFANLSSMNLNDFVFDLLPSETIDIDKIDLGNMILPKYTFVTGVKRLFNVRVNYDHFHSHIEPLFNIRSVLINGTFSRATFELYNCEFILNTFIPTRTETIIAKNNNLKYLDIRVHGDLKYRNGSFKNIDFSNNGMEFIHTSMLSLMPNLEWFQISKNNLYKMLEKDKDLFEELFSNSSKLKIIDLSENGLEHIPRKQFMNNVELTEIYLSNNLLQQVGWKMKHLTKLRILDLRNNRIALLDATSLNNLNRLIAVVPVQKLFELRMEENPIACSTCESKTFITWLMTVSIGRSSVADLTCTQANGDQGLIDTDQIHRLQRICDRPKVIIACSVTSGIVVLGVSLLAFALLRRRKFRRRRMKQKQLVDSIQQGDGEFEFVVMLSYNNIEEDFIRENVIGPLNETLQTMTEADRELVLTGDQHFRPGFMVHNEIATSLERVSLVVLLITNDFCTSGFCLSELDQAWIQRKPMIFMFKGDVDVNLMTPIMKTIYKKNVRILWTMEDGEYVLKTSWENVCQAILDLIIQK